MFLLSALVTNIGKEAPFDFTAYCLVIWWEPLSFSTTSLCQSVINVAH